MKNSNELKEMRSDIISQLEAIKDIATTTERDLTIEENNEVDKFLADIDELDVKIERAEKLETIKRNTAVASGVVSTKEDKDLSRYSFQEAMRSAYTGKIEGLVKEMDQEARNEARYTGQNFKGLAIPSSILESRANVGNDAVNATETMAFTDQLEANLVLASAGANFYSGINNMKFPVISGVNSYFVPEAGGSASTATGTASSITLTPKKLISVVNVSNEAMIQNPSLEAALRRNMAANIASTLEGALLNTADETNAPASIFADAATGPTAVTAADWVTMETTVLEAGVQLEGARMAYLLDADAYKTVKSLAQVASVSPIWDNADKRLNGYFGFVSGNVASSGTASKAHALFGDFSKVHIAQFGGLDVLFDPYTGGATGEPRMIITSLVDGDAAQNGAAFVNLIEA
tara:strand:+ start:1225 stop:2445 length:1221 start_codon:yes stop_codon:yes gene_type:complete